MISDVITAVSRTLDERFDGAYAVHTEKVEQGLAPPCFIITVVDAENTPLLRDRANRVYALDVVYISKSNTNAEMYAMADKLFSALGLVTMTDGSRLLAYNMRYEEVDGDLHFFVTYQLTVRAPEDEDAMESYSLNSEIGGI